MIVRALILAAALAQAAFAQAAFAQGFAGLGSRAEGFALPQRGRALSFPEDHGPHPNYRIEWWYLTANLKDASGQTYGVQWTLFRTALEPGTRPGWDSPQLYMGHAALTTPEQHLFSERRARGGVGQAGVVSQPFVAWIDEWVLTAPPGQTSESLGRLSAEASAPEFGFRLQLTTDEPLLLNGDRGFSMKSAEGHASYYYSQPHYDARGVVRLNDRTIAVEGSAWLDREWSSQPLASDQSGWDWFSLHLSDGAKLMGFRLRDSATGYVSGTYVSPKGAARPLGPGELRLVPRETARVSGRRLPVKWRIVLEKEGVDVLVSALNPRSFMDVSVPYWEGPVRIGGSHGGEGYLEMTGY